MLRRVYFFLVAALDVFTQPATVLGSNALGANHTSLTQALQRDLGLIGLHRPAVASGSGGAVAVGRDGVDRGADDLTSEGLPGLNSSGKVVVGRGFVDAGADAGPGTAFGETGHLRASAVALHQVSSTRESDHVTLEDALKCCLCMVLFSVAVSLLYALYLRVRVGGAFYDGLVQVAGFQAFVVLVAVAALVLTGVFPMAVPWLVVIAGTLMNFGFLHAHTAWQIPVAVPADQQAKSSRDR